MSRRGTVPGAENSQGALWPTNLIKLREMSERRERKAVYRSTARYLASHPTRAPLVWKWLIDRAASPLDLRSPWWPYTVPPWLLTHLPDGAEIFEFGAGGSTLWMEDHGFSVTAVESDASWISRLELHIRKRTTQVVLCEPSLAGTITSTVETGYFDQYVESIGKAENESLDLIVVDGRCRVAAAQRGIEKLKAGGLMLLDDAQRQRYGALLNSLQPWPHRVFVSPRPGGTPPAATVVWRKPFVTGATYGTID
jgi:hypothetical protein